MVAVTFPQNIPFFTGYAWGWLAFVFDWDTITILGNVTIQLSSNVYLCVDYLPCTLRLKGEADGAVEVAGNGQLVCLSSADCSTITIQSVVFTCSNNTKSVFKMQGSTLTLSSSSFTGCQADSDGGLIQAYDTAEVDIIACHFADIRSDGFGGVVAAYGSNLSILDSWLHNCTSRSGGGAIWASAFKDCYGSNRTQNTQLRISSSLLSSCSTSGAGGAVLAESGVSLGREVLDVAVSFVRFSQCTSKDEGGALRFSGNLVVARVQNTDIESCISDSAGGAISCSDSCSLSLISCTIHDNSAQGRGGGALHLNKSYFGAYSASIRNNRAPWGGGGALLWQGWVKPAAIDCPTGTSPSQDLCNSDAQDLDSFACQMRSCAHTSGTANRRKKTLRGTLFNQQAEYSPPGSNMLDTSVYCSLCAVNNSALYGSFIASDYRKLQISEAAESVFTGLPFNFTVTKQDAYGNTILSDSSSVLESIPFFNGAEGVELRTSILGSAVSKMSGGVASFQFAVKAEFSNINYGDQTVSLFGPIFLNITGEDIASGVQMEIGWVPVHIQQMANVCPRGYIFVPDNLKGGKVNGSAICSLCGPGFYSLSPLALSPDSSIDSPSCLSCPAGCDCTLGGEYIKFKSGLWKAIKGVYRLMSCPAGFQLVNSTDGTSKGAFSSILQQCKACLPGQYIIDPDTDACQPCPPGTRAAQLKS